MKTVLKAISCILALSLFVYLICFDYPVYRAHLKPVDPSEVQVEPDQMGDSSVDGSGVENLSAQLEQIEKQLDGLYEQCPPTNVVLCFDQINQSAYDELYPVLREQGYTGTLVLRDGQLPGDYEKITTEECSELVNEGWSFAVGGSNDIDMTGDSVQVLQEWGTYLNEYLLEIRDRIGFIPTTYCFNEGEYREEYEAVLREWGFTTIRYFAENASTDSSELKKIHGFRVAQTVDTENLVSDLNKNSSVMISTRLVSEQIENEERDTNIESYNAMLGALSESDHIKIVSLAEADAEDGEDRSELMEEIEELEQQRSKLEEQIEEK